jgi:signal transduction histidine kinase
MALLTVGIIIPMLAFSAFLVFHAADRERILMEREARDRAQSTAAAIEDMLGAVRARLVALTSSHLLQDGDFAEYCKLLGASLESQGLAIVLSDPDGHTIADTMARADQPVADFPPSAGLTRVAATSLPAISGFLRDPVSGAPVLLVSAPVLVKGRGIHVLSLNVATMLQPLLLQQSLPQGWLATVADRDGIVIARLRDSERYLGHPAPIYAVSAFQGADKGSFRHLSLDGIPVENFFNHVNLAGWAVVIAIPRSILLAPVWQSVATLALAGAVTLGFAVLLATIISRQVSRPIGTLVRMAAIVGGGGSFHNARTGLAEADAVAASLSEASDRLARSAADREKANHELRQSGERYRMLADELAEANDQRQALLKQIVQAQEEERLRIARELHDGLGQYLTGLKLGLTAMERSCPAGAAPQQLAALKALGDEMGHALGRMAWEIRPTALDDLGLETALSQYLEEWAERSGLLIDLEVRMGGKRLSPTLETTLFRVVQEAITNVIRHAEAKHAAVVLDAQGKEAQLIIEDDGRGLSHEKASIRVGSKRRHLGLLGMRERLALVTGNLEIESEPGKGTTLYIRVPLDQMTA